MTIRPERLKIVETGCNLGASEARFEKYDSDHSTPSKKIWTESKQKL